MSRILKISFALVTSVCIGAACSSSPSAPASVEAERETTECAESRSPICTQDYRPVCALRDNGVRCVTTPCDSTEWKTYSNGCSACSDPAVFSHRPGACETDE
jgi:hypothetical protein